MLKKSVEFMMYMFVFLYLWERSRELMMYIKMDYEW